MHPLRIKNYNTINELFEHIGNKIINPDYDYTNAEKNKKIQFENEKKEKNQNQERKKGVILTTNNTKIDKENKKSGCC